MLEKLKENEEYARFVDDSDAFVSFIAYEIEVSDHHGLFRVIGDEIGLGEDGVMRDVVRGLILFYGVEFEGVREFIKKEII